MGTCVVLVVTYIENHFCTRELPHVRDLFTQKVRRPFHLNSNTVFVMWKPHGQEGYETSQATASGRKHPHYLVISEYPTKCLDISPLKIQVNVDCIKKKQIGSCSEAIGKVKMTLTCMWTQKYSWHTFPWSIFRL